MKTIGIVVVAAFATSAAGVPLAAITLTRSRTKSAAIADNRSYYVPALDVAGFFEALTKCSQKVFVLASYPGIEISDHRHPRLLRARRERPGGCRAAKECNEVAPSHAIAPSQAKPSKEQRCASQQNWAADVALGSIAAGEVEPARSCMSASSQKRTNRQTSR